MREKVTMFPVDLHLHTVFSGDSTISPKLIVDQLHAHPLIKGVAITDHNTLEGYFQVHRLASVYEDLMILPACNQNDAQQQGRDCENAYTDGRDNRPHKPLVLFCDKILQISVAGGKGFVHLGDAVVLFGSACFHPA